MNHVNPCFSEENLETDNVSCYFACCFIAHSLAKFVQLS